jgi:hypothetical protein
MDEFNTLMLMLFIMLKKLKYSPKNMISREDPNKMLTRSFLCLTRVGNSTDFFIIIPPNILVMINLSFIHKKRGKAIVALTPLFDVFDELIINF